MSFPQRHPLMWSRRGYNLRLHTRTGNQWRTGFDYRSRAGERLPRSETPRKLDSTAFKAPEAEVAEEGEVAVAVTPRSRADAEASLPLDH